MRRGTKAHYTKHKKFARVVVHERLAYFNRHYQVIYKRVAIRNTRSRWGSCSKAGNLNFCYRVVLLPDELRDYVIVHELCHLKEFNHSPRFWAHVAQLVPDYRARRRALVRWRT